MRNFIVIGITGSTGSGKSTITNYLGKRDCYIIDADYLARAVVEKGSDCLLQICTVFGNDVINSDGTLNRKSLANIVFSSKENTQRLNNITHPFILMKAINMIDQIRKTNDNATIVFDAPLLFESKMDIICDYTIAVICDDKLRLERIMKRDNLTEKSAVMRMSVQNKDEFYIKKSDFVIDGSKKLSDIYVMADEIFKKVKKG